MLRTRLAFVILPLLAACGDSDQTASYLVPGRNAAIVVSRNPVGHLAEYDRTLHVEHGTRIVASLALGLDTGGYGRINLYRRDADLFELCDVDARYIVDARAGTIEKAATPACTGVYLGAFDAGRRQDWRFMSPAERPDTLLVRSGG